MKILVSIINLLVFLCLNINAQTDIQLKLEDFIKSKYSSTSFEGVKIVSLGEAQFLVSMAVTSDANHKTTSTLNRVAMIKARRETLKFINGSSITSETILETSETVSDRSVNYYESFFDRIKENSAGWVQGMSVLTSWYSNNGKDYVLAIYNEIK